jgi:hypothetical protein
MLRLLALTASVSLITAASASHPVLHPLADREAVIRVLESMITKDVPADVDHGEYYWVRGAIDALIAGGDHQVERLALRAARPLRATISTPASSINSPAHLLLSTPTVLHLRRTIPYTATVYASLDGADLVKLGTYNGAYGAIPLAKALGEAAIRPGGHHLRIRAQLAFAAGEASWTETRDLPELFYAIYDPSHADSYGRKLVYGPAEFTAAHFDPALPAAGLESWLTQTVTAYRRSDEHASMWSSRHCSERSGDPKGLLDSRGVCAVLVFETSTVYNAQLWFRTADVQLKDDHIVWVPLAVPRFEGIVFGDRNADRLSALNDLLQSPPTERLGADAAILPGDIVISRGRSDARAEIQVTVRNRGADHLFGAYVLLEYGSDRRNPFGHRRFVVNLPPSSSKVIRASVTLSGPYAWVLAQVVQGSEHGPSEGIGDDPTPGDSCALLAVNSKAAPADLLATFKERAKMSCQVLLR